jgi:hypothetical protein
MLFPKRKQEDLLRQSLMKRFNKTKLLTEKTASANMKEKYTQTHLYLTFQKFAKENAYVVHPLKQNLKKNIWDQ